MLMTLVERLPRALLLCMSPSLPALRQIRYERYLRGFEDHRRIGRADAVIVSFGKSGRTWLRVMLSRFFGIRYGLPEKSLMGFDNLSRRHRSIPKLLFTHDNYLADFTGERTSKSDYFGNRVLLLVRDPADVAVSQYFQWRHRMKPRKKRINAYPAHGTEMEVADFVLDEGGVLVRIVEFMNLWASERERFGDALMIVRYEDLRAEPEAWLAKVLAFLGTPGSQEEIEQAVAFASVDNMRKMELTRGFQGGGRRMRAGDEKNPDSYKVRRAKVGGYRDYFSADELSRIDRIIDQTLAPEFGYARNADTTTS